VDDSIQTKEHKNTSEESLKERFKKIEAEIEALKARQHQEDLEMFKRQEKSLEHFMNDCNKLDGQAWVNAVAVEAEKLGADKEKCKEWAGRNYWLYCNIVGTPKKIGEIYSELSKDKLDNGHVYVFKFKDIVKVGYTRNTASRMLIHEKNLSKKCLKSFESESISVKRCVQIESEICSRLYNKRIREFGHREWFHPEVFETAVGIIKELTAQNRMNQGRE
jgi:hypothetical protein